MQPTQELREERKERFDENIPNPLLLSPEVGDEVTVTNVQYNIRYSRERIKSFLNQECDRAVREREEELRDIVGKTGVGIAGLKSDEWLDGWKDGSEFMKKTILKCLQDNKNKDE